MVKHVDQDLVSIIDRLMNLDLTISVQFYNNYTFPYFLNFKKLVLFWTNKLINLNSPSKLFMSKFFGTKCSMSMLQEPDGMSCVLQDFEIAGSRTGALSTDCAGGCECETPLGTINSWDSHSHYRHHAASPDLSLYSGVIVYCDYTHLKTATGLIRVLLIVSQNLV